MVKDLLGMGLIFGALIVALIIVGAMASEAYDVGIDVATNDTLINNLWDSSTTALTTFADFLPIIAIALVGGMAVAYLFGFLGSTKGA